MNTSSGAAMAGAADRAVALGVALGAQRFRPPRVRILFEQAQLKRAFGGWYSDYAAETPRWF